MNAMPSFAMPAFINSQRVAQDEPLLHVDDTDLMRGDFTAEDEGYFRQISAILNEHYPGHQWVVSPRSKQGVVHIRNYGLSDRFGYTLHVKNIKQHDDLKRLTIMMAGELLERFDVPRERFKIENYDHIWRLPQGERYEPAFEGDEE